jgi:hypothetical protein
MAQVVEHLLNKFKALYPSPEKVILDDEVKGSGLTL